MPNGCDVSENNGVVPTSTLAGYEFVIVRTSHGLVEDKTWRHNFNNAVTAGCQVGFYHYFEQTATPEDQARFFAGLTNFLTAQQVFRGWWLDAEEGWVDDILVDRFRSAAHLPTVGLYSTLSLFNAKLKSYLHFGLNWLPLLPGWKLEPGWQMPDHILTQVGQQGGLDYDIAAPAQPYPPAWEA